jgi:hypothetical protein
MPTKSTFVQVVTPGRYRTSSPSTNVSSADNWSHQWTDSRTDGGPVQGYRQKIARGQDATTSLVGSKRLYESTTGYYMVRFKRKPNVSPFLDAWAENEHYGDMTKLSMPTVGNSSLTIADNTALMAFTQKAQQAYTALQGGVVLGEIAETLHMLRRPAQGFRRGLDDFFRDLRRKRKGSSRQRLRALSDSWLEHSFGWQPLLHDIEDAGAALERIKLRLSERKFIKAVGKSQLEGGQSVTIGSMNGAHTFVKTDRQYSEAIVVYRGTVVLPIGDRALFARQNLGFTLGNFVPTLWELVPYSFLVDYFTNIGEILTAWSSWDINWGWKNRTQILRRCREAQTGGFVSFNYNPDWYDIEKRLSSPCTSKTETRDVSRAVYSGSMIPDFRFEIPGISSLKWLNLAALASSRRSLSPF